MYFMGKGVELFFLNRTKKLMGEGWDPLITEVCDSIPLLPIVIEDWLFPGMD